MKPLHSSYHNLGSWRMLGKARDAEIRIVYHARPQILSAALLFFLCMAAAAVMYFKLPSGGAVVGIAAGTGIVVPAIMVAYALSRSKKGPILTYQAPADILLVSEPPMEIPHAYQRVSFSRERFQDGDDYGHEFNLVVDGERKKFLSSSSDSFSKISGFVTEMGFRVTEQKIKL